MTYARARLWTGVSCVGLLVTLATLLLVLGLPTEWLADRGGDPRSDAALIFAVLGVGALLMLPFDVAGGFVVPRRFGRPAPGAPRFALAWLRGVLALMVLSTTAGTLLLAAGRLGGRPAALAVFVAASLALAHLQAPIARLVGGMRAVLDPDGTLLIEGHDPGFSGGFTGTSGTAVLPASWRRAFDPRALELLVQRRRHILGSGARTRALLLAIAWNAVGFLLASWLPGAGVSTLAELVTTALGFTLWTFAGLLLLPTPSRRATFSIDASVVEDEQGRALLDQALRTLDKLQDDEPERSPGLERVFHPVPSVTNRLRALRARGHGGGGAWNLARTALYLSHVGLSGLPRAVHCNVGRPELWVYLPTDG